jgi:hypothetical protein
MSGWTDHAVCYNQGHCSEEFPDTLAERFLSIGEDLDGFQAYSVLTGMRGVLRFCELTRRGRLSARSGAAVVCGEKEWFWGILRGFTATWGAMENLWILRQFLRPF